MSARQGRWMAWAVAVAMTMLGTARAQVPGADRTCGTPGTAAAPVSSDREDGRGSTPTGLGLVPASRLFPNTVEVTTGSGGGMPAAPVVPAAPPAVVASAPPPPGTAPALPGLPPAAAKTKDDDEDRPRVEAIQATVEVPEERLLDIGIGVFDAGVTEKDRERLAERGLSPELRRAEGRFAAFHLKKTMEGTGHWGAVRVLPGPGEGLDVYVSGAIVQSNGKTLELAVEATDATGRRWLERRYKGEADISAYRPERVGQYEPFQELYNRIANDLLAARDELTAEQLVSVRRVAVLRFAAELAPESFTGYLDAQGSGRYALKRLPAKEDPMVRRVADIRDRDQMLVDTLNDHYQSFYERMGSAYASWRQDSYQEQAALDKINRESKLKKILGAGAMLAGLVMSGSDSQGGRIAGDVAMLGGWAALAAGSQQAQEKQVHVAALKELALSVDGEVAPLLVEVEGQQLKLTGSAEKQFAEWRSLLRHVFAIETGLPGDPNTPVVVPGPPSL
jgi:hypothetical protein